MIWVVTSLERVYDEALVVHELFAAGLEVLLVRKPSVTDSAALLDQIDTRFHAKIILAGHMELLERYNVMGFHMSERLRLNHTFARPACCISTSVHEAVEPPGQWDYLLLGPVFDSISKPGYHGRLASFGAIPRRTIAIGGVDAGNVGQLKVAGFAGAALLGTVWRSPASAVQEYQNVKLAWSAGMWHG